MIISVQSFLMFNSHVLHIHILEQFHILTPVFTIFFGVMWPCWSYTHTHQAVALVLSSSTRFSSIHFKHCLLDNIMRISWLHILTTIDYSDSSVNTKFEITNETVVVYFKILFLIVLEARKVSFRTVGLWRDSNPEEGVLAIQLQLSVSIPR
jgi:hypothetical protein